MYLSFKAIRSGSSGNFYLLRSEQTTIAIDMGLSSQKLIISSLANQGLEPQDLDAILVSHTHTDHISYAGLRICENYGLSMMLPAPLVPAAQRIYAAKRLARPPKDLLQGFGFQPMLIKDIMVTPFAVPHDVIPTSGFRFQLRPKDNGPVITMATDLGHVPSTVMSQFVNSDLIVIEANYDSELLKQSARPFQQIQRIGGPNGHLSNMDTARMLQAISQYGKAPKLVMLAHLSRDHNTPGLASKTIKEYLIARAGVQPGIVVAPRKRETDWITVS